MALVKGVIGWIATGSVTKDAEYKEVGSKSTPLTKFSINVGKIINQESGELETKFVNCNVWFQLAEAAASIKKHDIVMVSGDFEKREWEGRPFWDLKVECFTVAPKKHHTANSLPAPAVNNNFYELDDDIDDSALPF